jgi:hypothetical protein
MKGKATVIYKQPNPISRQGQRVEYNGKVMTEDGFVHLIDENISVGESRVIRIDWNAEIYF